jgi:protocatechuate 3,4-dioxygenase beta subunit
MKVLLVLLLIIILAFAASMFFAGEAESLSADGGEGESPDRRIENRYEGSDQSSMTSRQQVVAEARESAGGEPGAMQVSGRLVDVSGDGLAGLRVGSRSGTQPVEVVTAEDGSFAMSFQGGRMDLRVTEEGWATLAAGQVEADSGAGRVEPVIIAAREINVAGIVRDQSGNPLPGVDLRYRLPRGFAASFPLSLDAAKLRDEVWRIRSDENGRYRLPAVGAVMGASIVARKSNYLPGSQDLPGSSRQDLDFVLEQPRPDADAVLGQVVDLAGYPVEAAHVCLGTSGALSDAEGRFALSRKDSHEVQTIRAMKRGWLPAQSSLPDLEAGQMTPFVTLRLAGPPMRITGRILDSRGRAVSGVRVWALAPDQFAGTPGHVSHVEAYLAGGMTTEELRQRFTRDGELSADMGDLRVQHPTSFWGWVKTDAAGRFELGGLQRKDYQLRILSMESLQMADVGPYPAGSEALEILFDPEISPVIAGRVLGADGLPVEGVSVQANCVPIRSRFEWPDGRSQSNSEPTHDGPIQRTDAQGRFRFENLGAREIYLTMRGDHILVDLLGLADGGLQAAGAGPLDDLIVRVVRRMQLRVSLSIPELADSFAVMDGNDEALQIASYEGGGMATSRRWRLSAGKSPVLAVSEAARTVQLYLDGQLVRRIPLDLVFGEVNRIDL